jgi:hypothetical protein
MNFEMADMFLDDLREHTQRLQDLSAPLPPTHAQDSGFAH